jgi:hypothetical protein
MESSASLPRAEKPTFVCHFSAGDIRIVLGTFILLRFYSSVLCAEEVYMIVAA